MSTAADTPAAKRPRTDDGPSTLTERRKHDKYWFDDGNIIIAAETIAFRLHRGVICHHSQVFRDMFSAPHTGESEDMIDGCPVVRVSDCGEYLAWFFALLYDGGRDPFFNPTIAAQFEMVRAMLILAYKYDVDYVRAEALRRLRLRCPATLAAIDAEWYHHSNPTAHIVHDDGKMDCIGMVCLARAFNLPELLPSPFEILIVAHDPADLMKRREYGFGQYDELSPQDLRRCLSGIKRFADRTQAKLRLFLAFEASSECLHADASPDDDCVTQVRDAAAAVNGYAGFNSHYLLTPHDILVKHWLDNVCQPCREKWRTEYEHFRGETWSMFGDIIGIEPWPIPEAQP